MPITKQLVEWAENCPENFANRALLVGAEIARIEGRELDAERLYEAAIRSARENDVRPERSARQRTWRLASTLHVGSRPSLMRICEMPATAISDGAQLAKSCSSTSFIRT